MRDFRRLLDDGILTPESGQRCLLSHGDSKESVEQDARLDVSRAALGRSEFTTFYVAVGHAWVHTWILGWACLEERTGTEAKAAST